MGYGHRVLDTAHTSAIPPQPPGTAPLPDPALGLERWQFPPQSSLLSSRSYLDFGGPGATRKPSGFRGANEMSMRKRKIGLCRNPPPSVDSACRSSAFPFAGGLLPPDPRARIGPGKKGSESWRRRPSRPHLNGRGYGRATDGSREKRSFSSGSPPGPGTSEQNFFPYHVRKYFPTRVYHENDPEERLSGFARNSDSHRASPFRDGRSAFCLPGPIALRGSGGKSPPARAWGKAC